MKNLENIPVEQSNNAKNKKHKVKKGIATNFANEEYIVKKKWYEELPDDPTDLPKVSEDVWIALKNEAKKCNDADVLAYNVKSSKTNSDYKWMKTAMAKGTVSDRIAAFIILIQDEPVCNLPTIHNIISMIKVGKKKECITAIETLTDLMLSDLLRPNVKLKAFYDRPHSKLDELSSGNTSTKRKILSYWYFEDQLKECYTAFVQAVNAVAHDTVEANKEKAIAAMYKLLVGNSEQEKNLLAYIANKLGDPSQKVASKAIYCLGQVIYEHPNMKQVVLGEIERLLFRPNVSTRSQYYSICFLTQFILTVDDYDVAKNLIAVYFAFFKACVKKEQVDSRMMSALLTGVNRAYPFAKTELTKIQEHIDTMYKVVHVATFNVSIHALNLLYQISSSNETGKDRFYTALYRKLQDPEIGTTKHQALFLNLVFRALRIDTELRRVKAFIKRLLEVAMYMQPAMACGILFLIQQLMKEKKYVLALKNVPDKNSTEQIISLNSALKDVVDDNVETTEEQTTSAKEKSKQFKKYDPGAEINGIQINVARIQKTKEPEEEKPKKDTLDENLKDETDDILVGDVKIKSEFNHPKITTYNPLSRNPLYAGGDFCVYIELLNLQKHFHPTVALYTSKILNAENIYYSGDPLKDFTLSRFLERFSFKNPKTAQEVEKKGVNPIFGKRKLEVATGIKSLAVNSKSYLNHNQKKIPVEEQFMYTYLLQKQEEQKHIKEDDDDSDVDSVASDEFEEMLHKMSGSTKMDEELDFMNDVGESLKNTKKGKKRGEDSDSDDDDDGEDDDEAGEDDEIDFSGDDDFGDEDLDEVDDKEDFGGDKDDEDLDFDDDEENDVRIDSDSDNDTDKNARKSKKKIMKKGRSKDDMGSLFASADEFASILDEDADYMAGTSHAVSNKDNAHLKQISWEQNRDRWLKGYNNAVGKGGKKFDKNKSNKQFANKSKKNFSKKRPKPQQGGNKNKKQKKH